MAEVSVSVVVPVYNSEDTIESCLKSILCQTLSDIEVIVVDDGSTDNSGSIIDSFAASRHCVSVVHQQNAGRTEARAVGVNMAHGIWVSFVDSDDTLPPDALQTLYARADDTTDIVMGNGSSLPDERREVIPMSDFRHLTVRADGTIGVPWGSLYRRTVLTPWLFDMPRDIVNGEDYLFWLRLVFATDKPVNVVYEKVYEKGDEHTSNSFVWTADYCYRLNELRKASIPSAQHDIYQRDMIHDRLANMFSVAQWSKRSTWQHSAYYRELLADMQSAGMTMPWKSRLYLSLPSLALRRFYSYISQKIHR